MTLTQFFELSLRARRGEVALEWRGATATFGDLAHRAATTAAALAARGVSPGDRVAAYLPNGPFLVDLYLACARLGAIFVPVNILYRDRELTHIVGDSAPAALVCTAADAAALGGDTRTFAGVAVWTGEDLERDARCRRPAAEAPLLDGDSAAMLVYTSGTTGRAKGALLTHNNLVANASALVTCWQITERDRFLLALPMFHVHGLGNGLHCWLAAGCRVRLLERFDRATIAGEFLEFGPTLFFGVPTMYARLVELPEETARRIGGRARLFVSGSAALPPQVFEAFRARFGHAILERYGMSETLMTISNPYAGARRPGTIGVPLPGVSARVLDDQGREVPPDHVGELYVQGPTVFREYWRNEEATRAAFARGAFRTGDLASRDARGIFTLHGRRGDLIISGGFNIYPREIEQVLEEHPAVAEAAVVGEPDDRRGEVPIAYVVARSGAPTASLDADALEAHCRAHLASFKVPRTFVAVDRLPRNALGKITKALLRR